MERYKEYKDSGVKWIGEVPGHWEMRRLKYIFSEKKDKAQIDEGLLLSLTRDKGIIPAEEKTQKTMQSSSLVGYKIVSPNDVVFNRFKARLFARSRYNGLISSDYAVYGVHGVDIDYIVTLLNTPIYREAFNRKASGIGDGFSRLYTDDLFQFYAIFPPLSEQRAIVRFLDDKCGKIDRVVESKSKEIALLKELRQSVIAEAVTRGINPNAPLKNSNIPWIGEIPEGWEVKRAKNMFVKNKRESNPEDEVITCFRDGQVTLRKNRRTTGFTESLTESGYQGVKKGDLVIHQMDAFAGAIGVSDSDGKGTSVYHCCTPIGDYDVYFYAYILRVMAKSGYIQSLYRGIRERSSDFKFPIFANQYLPIPPLAEQRAIVAHIDAQCARIDAAIAHLQAEIGHFKDYRQRLISDAVTGRICVLQ